MEVEIDTASTVNEQRWRTITFGVLALYSLKINIAFKKPYLSSEIAIPVL